MPILREGARSVYPYLRKGKQSLLRYAPLSRWGEVRGLKEWRDPSVQYNGMQIGGYFRTKKRLPSGVCAVFGLRVLEEIGLGRNLRKEVWAYLKYSLQPLARGIEKIA